MEMDPLEVDEGKTVWHLDEPFLTTNDSVGLSHLLHTRISSCRLLEGKLMYKAADVQADLDMRTQNKTFT